MVLVFIACEGECTFPDDDLEVVLLRLPVPHVASVNTHGDRPIWDGEVAPIPGAALDETPLFLAQFRFTALGHLQGIMPHRLDVERDIEMQAILPEFVDYPQHL